MTVLSYITIIIIFNKNGDSTSKAQIKKIIHQFIVASQNLTHYINELIIGYSNKSTSAYKLYSVHNINIGSFAQIKQCLQIYQRLCHSQQLSTLSPMIDSFIFHKIMPTTIPLGKKNCDIIFGMLCNGQKYISVYELIGILILTSYQTYTKKFQFLQIVFDFGHKNKIYGKQFMLIYYSIFFGYSRITGNFIPQFEIVQKFGQAIFFPGEQQADYLTKQVTLRKFIEQYQASQIIGQLFNKFQFYELKQIKEDFLVYTHSQLKRYTKDQINKIYRILNKCYRYSDYQQLQIIHQNKQLRRQNRRDSCYQKLLQQKTALTQNTKISPTKNSSLPKKIRGTFSLAKLNNITPQRSQSTFRLKNLSKTELKKIQPHKKTLVFLDGKTYSKRQIFDSINYFKSLSENNEQINIKQFFKTFSKKSFLKKQVSSLFKFLDYKKSGEITLEDYFKSLYPGVTKQDLYLLKKWYKIYQQIYQANNLQINQIKIVQMTDTRILPPNTLQRLQQIFSAMDTGNKGFLTFQDLRKSYKRGFTADQLQNLLKQYGKNGNMYLGGLAKLLLPVGWSIQGVNLDFI